MPQKQLDGPFLSSPDFDPEASLQAEIIEFRQYIEQQVAEADEVQNEVMQRVLYFSILDSLVQEYYGYSSGKQAERFADFVLSHQNVCDYLDQVEPVTLYYRIEDIIEERHCRFIDGLSYKKIDIESYRFDGKTMTDGTVQEFAGKLIQYLGQKKGKAFAEKKQKEHRLVNLLYRMRSKATHELTNLGGERVFMKRLGKQEPFYYFVTRSYVENQNWFSDEAVYLVIPNQFIRKILVSCIDHYLSECWKVKRSPYENNRMTRKHKLSWYED